jgi:DNA repair photolyase
MGDGGSKPLAEVRVGDAVYGTLRVGADSRLVVTRVLAHWASVKPAYRVSLEDGTELVASGEHRFLTEQGWKHVTGAGCTARDRPHLKPGDSLMGCGRRQAPVGALSATSVGPGGTHVAESARASPVGSGPAARPLGLVAVEALGRAVPMFDITTGTGDFIANGVVSHNCFARPTHEYLGLGIGEDFERRIVVKVNAVERLAAELADRRWSGDHIAMGTNTDPYQRCEGKYHLTRGIVQALRAAKNPFSILTKSTLILRDLDVLTEAARHADVRCNFSIGTLDEEVWKLTEPGTPHPRRRVEAVRRLNEAGIPCGVLVAPVLPGLSDGDEQLEEVVSACVEAGATSISAIALHLRPGVRDHFLASLRAIRPALADDYERRYRRAYLPAKEQEALSRRVRRLAAGVPGREPVRPSDDRRGAEPSHRGRPAPAHCPSPRQLGLGF